MDRKGFRRSARLGHDSTPLPRLASAAHEGLALFCEALAPGGSRWPGRAWVERLDERLARSRREAFGRRGWLISWHREPDGSWRVRLSGPELVRTIERSARTRSRAIVRTARALAGVKSFHALTGERR